MNTECLTVCKSCKHSYNDIEEGWLCRKFDKTIILSNGDEFKWPGQKCETAYKNDCQMEGFDKSIFSFIKTMQSKTKVFFLFAFCFALSGILSFIAN